MEKKVSYLITKGDANEKSNYLLSKFLDYRSGSAVCVSRDVENNHIFIKDCPASLRDKLRDEIGKGVCDYVAIIGDVNISDVIKHVSEWVNEQD